MEREISSGWKMIKVNNGVYTFLSQLESFTHRRANFEYLTPIELECNVDIKNNDNDDEGNLQKVKPRKGIELGKSNPMIDLGYKWFARAKFCIPAFGGKHVPVYPEDHLDVICATGEDLGKADQIKKNYLSGSLKRSLLRKLIIMAQ